ncbi:MAG: prepilin-type N-terminal cleavage/methylation domain-containing protein [Smithella sp.]|nr:prepilin-type N-terminal cleavage/methylation domain-containing protein [Smithella sp.]
MKSRTKKAVVKIEAGIVVAENIIKIQTRGRTMNKKGFTLIELMIVVAIIGILAAIAIPQFSAYRIKSFNTKAKTELKGAYTACQVYFSTESGATSCGIGGMQAQKFFNSNDVTIAINDPDMNNWTATAKHDAGNVTYTIDKNGKITP